MFENIMIRQPNKVEPEHGQERREPAQVQKKSILRPGVGSKKISFTVGGLARNEQTAVNPGEIPANYKEVSSSSTASIGSQGSRHIFIKKADATKAVIVRKEISKLTRFRRTFCAVVFSPIFVRHRNIFFMLVEIFAPALVAFIVFAAFTSGISWKQMHNTQMTIDNMINFPELSMETAVARFVENHADVGGRTLIFFTPVTPTTVRIMKHTISFLGLERNNRLYKYGYNGNGIIGVESDMEMVERAMQHRFERRNHGRPVGVIFRYNTSDINELTGIPYDVKYTISTFHQSISETADNYPFVPPTRSTTWQTPYVSTGFIGLQYAIEKSITLVVLEQFRELYIGTVRRLSADVEDAKVKIRSRFVMTASELGKLSSTKPDADTHNVFNFTVLNPDQARSLRNHPIWNTSQLPKTTLKMFNYANHRNKRFRALISYAVTFTLVVAYSFMGFFIVRQIVEENISGIKDLLAKHGLPQYIHWVLLFVHALFFRAITSALIVVALKMDYGYGSIVEIGSTSVVFMIIWIHEVALTFMNFFVATCVHSVSMSGVVAITSGVLSFYLPEAFDGMKLVGIYTNYGMIVVFPNWCLHHLVNCLIDTESDDKGVRWGTVWDKPHVENKLSAGGGMLILFGSGLVYFALAVYQDVTSSAKLFPPSTKWFDIRERSRQKRESRAHHVELLQDIEEGRENNFDKPSVYETPTGSKKCFVHIRNLSKHYGKHEIALTSINMNIMHEEITVVLGHGGSGKSTLINILSGMVMPTSGYATVKGYDVHFESKKAREFTGLCPQKLVAFNLLTVREHVVLCYRLRGYSSRECHRHVATLLTKMKLWDVRSFLPDRLTNEELRRLGIALAMADAPKILLLDEPTGGMDSMGRREVWKILASLRIHHTIILTTNYMDEAEFLADRVALLAHGRLVCFGSIDFLKSMYDTGYFMKIDPSSLFNQLDVKQLMLIAHRHLGPAVRQRKHDRIKDVDSVVLELPTDQKPHFADLCEELEEKKSELNIQNYSIRQVSLSDIFIKICLSVAASGFAMDLYVRRDSAGEITTALTSEIPKLPSSPLVSSHRHHFMTLLAKRWSMIKQSTHFIIFHYLIPLSMIWMVVFQAKLFVLPSSEHPERVMSTAAYKNDDLKLFYRVGSDDSSAKYGRHLASYLKSEGAPLHPSERIVTKLFESLTVKREDVGYVKQQHMMAFELRRTSAEDSLRLIGYFASGALHSPSITLNIMNNVLLQAIQGPDGKNARRHTITVVNDPMPVVGEAKYEKGCGVTCVFLALLMSFSLGFISYSCIIVPLMEKEIGIKHMQLMCGVHPALYWAADFVVDVLVMLTMALFIVIIFVADYYRTFRTTAAIVALWLVCVLFLTWSGLMYSYFMSTVINIKRNGYNVLVFLHLAFGIIPMLFLVNPDYPILVFIRNISFFFIPPFTITAAFHSYFSVCATRTICNGMNDYVKRICDVRENPHDHYFNRGHFNNETELYEMLVEIDPKLTRCCERYCLPTKSCFSPPPVFSSSHESWQSPGLITITLALFFEGLFYGGLLVLQEHRAFPKLIERLMAKFHDVQERRISKTKTPGDVHRENILVNSLLQEEIFPIGTTLLCKDLTKTFHSKTILKEFNLEVKNGQCVAILGGCGSGKSTIVKIISGETLPTKGCCYTSKASLFNHRQDYLSSIGYCPEKNCLFPEFTGAQMLKLMGRLRGIPANVLSTHVEKWIGVFGLTEVANDKCKLYGHGMTQRLGAAMSLIGGSKMILLDEPTSGVDPAARERFWAVIEHLNKEGHTVLFTSYNADECFTLAEKVVVISGGRVQCVGSPEELLKRYGRGHLVLFKLKHDVLSAIELGSVTMGRVSEFKEIVKNTFSHISLLDEHDDSMIFFLRDGTLNWADVFRKANYLATTYSSIVESYEVNESEIEDVFIFLTNKFHELDKPRNSEPPTIIEMTHHQAEVKALKDAAGRMGVEFNVDEIGTDRRLSRDNTNSEEKKKSLDV